MNETVKTPRSFEEIAADLPNGFVVVDSAGRILWLDERARRCVNGGLPSLKLPLVRPGDTAADCFISTVEIMTGGRRVKLCVLQESELPREQTQELATAVEAVMSDGSWLARTMIEKLKSWFEAKQPKPRSSDLDVLTIREREILALICEGRSDAEMSRVLGLSQNTIRNHIASLYRKIGVNRRGAAIIWAHERGVTSYEFMAAPRRRRSQQLDH